MAHNIPEDSTSQHWTVCPKCHGMGKKMQKISRKAQRLYEKELDQYKKT